MHGLGCERLKFVWNLSVLLCEIWRLNFGEVLPTNNCNSHYNVSRIHASITGQG